VTVASARPTISAGRAAARSASRYGGTAWGRGLPGTASDPTRSSGPDRTARLNVRLGSRARRARRGDCLLTWPGRGDMDARPPAATGADDDPAEPLSGTERRCRGHGATSTAWADSRCHFRRGVGDRTIRLCRPTDRRNGAAETTESDDTRPGDRDNRTISARVDAHFRRSRDLDRRKHMPQPRRPAAGGARRCRTSRHHPTHAPVSH
jgi:hypothetical protein